MSGVIKGQQGMVLRAINRRYSPDRGWSSVYVYETGDKALAEQFGSSQANASNSVDFDLVGPPYRVEVSAPDAGEGTQDDTFEDQWEVPAVEVTKSIFETDAFRALDAAEQSALRSLANDPGQDYDAILADLTSANAIDYSLLILKGTTDVQAPTAALRWTRIVSRNYSAVSAAYQSVNRIFSLNTITGLQGMPANIVTAVTQAQGNVPVAASGYATGWLKKMSTITYRGAGKVEITQEWTLENWSTVLYGNLV